MVFWTRLSPLGKGLRLRGVRGGLQKQSAEDARKYLTSVAETHFGLYTWDEHPDTLRYSRLVF